MGSGGGIPSGFVAFFVLVVLAGIGFTAWRVSAARRMASEAGLDPDRAGAMALLTDDGLEATYLASSLRTPQPQGPARPDLAATAHPQQAEQVEQAQPLRTATERLTELEHLRDAGAVTQAEYDERRKAIIDSI
ncbi:MAG TPA: SHOCT domain-containing protein [Marmoricola sp.]|nr:SHOCT domain-containing protein [Marmoricola sp.]